MEVVGNFEDLGLGGNASSGKSDKGFGFSEDDIGDGGVASENSGHCRIGEDGDIGDSVLSALVYRCGGFGHLHKAKKTFLHSGSTGGAEDDHRALQFDAALQGSGDFLAIDRAHRSAHEVEIGNGGGDELTVDGSRPGHEAIFHAGFGLGLEVLFFVLRELEGIAGEELGVKFGERIDVESDFDSLLPGEAVVVVAIGADAEVGFEIGDEEGFLAAFALDEVGVRCLSLPQWHRG